MKQLFIPSDLGELFLGGLLTVARVDGIVKPEEMSSLRATADELGLTMPDEEELLFAEDVTVEMLAGAFKGRAGAYRGSGSTPDEIGEAFLDAALRLALADRELAVEEVLLLRELASALGAAVARIPGWPVVRGFQA